ncbi:PaaI family thioesterase [Nocardia bovistercoris]|uniref:PaaI family thioesterase n=1 Tax=Nocardia bovistercoris TaxID=2785916 RepID=A0A931MZL4_9NOCA|nr:PaaI family thioesterase [Nocardia bovistercoris]MBH0776270.1 PaaI family thioesterase [Nocardia bovistercoris]
MTQQEPSTRSLAGVTPEQLTTASQGSFADLVGLRYTEITPDRVRGELIVKPHLFQPMGIVNGGVYCTVIETMASIAAAVWLGDGGTVVGVNNNTDFLRAVREGTLSAEATPVHRGRTQQLWLVVLTDEQQRVVARGQVRLQNLVKSD